MREYRLKNSQIVDCTVLFGVNPSMLVLALSVWTVLDESVLHLAIVQVLRRNKWTTMNWMDPSPFRIHTWHRLRCIAPIPSLGCELNGVAGCHMLELHSVGPQTTSNAIGVFRSHRNWYDRYFIVEGDLDGIGGLPAPLFGNDL
jgi:hypothetical protein